MRFISISDLKTKLKDILMKNKDEEIISIQLIFASRKRDKSKFPKIEFDLTDTAKSNIDSFLKSTN